MNTTLIIQDLKLIIAELCLIKYQIYKDEKEAIERITILQDKLMLLISQSK